MSYVSAVDNFFLVSPVPYISLSPSPVPNQLKPHQKRNVTAAMTNVQARNPLDFQSVDDWLRAIKMEH